MEKAAAERKAAADAAAAEKEAEAAAKAAERKAAAEAPKPAPAPTAPRPAPTPAAPKPAPAKKAEAPKPAAKPAAKPAPKKAPAPGLGDYIIGDITVAALAALAATGILVPSVKDKALGGDVEGAIDDAKQVYSTLDGIPGKAAYVGGVIAVDAIAHLPLIGFFLPGPMEFVGTCSAILLAARYYVTKDSTPAEDFSNFVRSIPADVPAVDDVVNPVTSLANKLSAPDFDAVQNDVTSWFEGLDDPVDEIAPPAAALVAVYLASKVTHFPLLGLVLPRAFELVGAAYLIAAVNRYGRDNTNVSLVKDLQGYVKQGGDVVKTLVSK